MKNKFVRIIAAVLAIVWMLVIYSYSSDTAEISSEVSISLSYQIVDSVQTVFGLEWNSDQIQKVADSIEWMVRKAAHMTEYGILCVFLGVAMYVWRPVDYNHPKPKLMWVGRALTDVLICGIYAATDEFHQTFVEGRSGKPTDVIIDVCGALLFLCVITFFTHIHYKKTQGKQR